MNDDSPRRSVDYYANRLVGLAMNDPSVDVTDENDLRTHTYEMAERLVLPPDELWASVKRFHRLSGNFTVRAQHEPIQ